MSLVFLKSCLCVNSSTPKIAQSLKSNVSKLRTIFVLSRNFGDDYAENSQFTCSTILVEESLNIQELPVIVKKIKDVNFICSYDVASKSNVTPTDDVNNYHLIQSEFRQCSDVREVFSLLSKCMKITPNIALGAMERITEIEANCQLPVEVDSWEVNAKLAKSAIIDKLLKVVIQTEDTQTLLNALNAVSSVMEPFKHKFCDEILLRVVDNNVTVEQLCEFISFLGSNKNDLKFAQITDKLWMAFVEQEANINEINIVKIFNILHHFKTSRRIVKLFLEKKFLLLWPKIKNESMCEIVRKLALERSVSYKTMGAIGRWLLTNIHMLDDDSLLDILTKLSKLKYKDVQIEKAMEKYVKMKYTKIQSQMLIVGILNYCSQFRLSNTIILSGCLSYFLNNASSISHSFLRSFIYPFGYLQFDPGNIGYWDIFIKTVEKKIAIIPVDDLLSIILSGIYLCNHPLDLINKVFKPQFLANMSNLENSELLQRKLNAIDIALTLECSAYCGPRLPKQNIFKDVMRDSRIKKIVGKIQDSLECIVSEVNKMTTSVSIPYLNFDETYFIDILIHSAKPQKITHDWKKVHENAIALLIHTPEHYCNEDEALIGPQVMRKRHLQLLGMKVVSLNYKVLNNLLHNKNDLLSYVKNCIENSA